MDTSVAIQLIILLILLILSGFFSSAETALTTVNRMRIRGLADEGNKKAKTVMHITDDTSKMLSAILIGIVCHWKIWARRAGTVAKV